MAVTVVQVTKIDCDGVDAACSKESRLSYPKSQSVAARLASRLGWSVSGDIICPTCLKAHAL